MDDTITLVSTSDSPEEVAAALTGTPPAAKPAEKAVEKPAAKPADPAAPVEKPVEAAKPVETKADEKVDEIPANETPEQKADREASATRVSSRQKRLDRIQSDIDAAYAKKKAAEREADAETDRLADIRRKREQAEAEIAAKPKEPETPATAKHIDLADEPKLDAKKADGADAYATYEDWQSDHAKWTIRKSQEAAQTAAEHVAAQTKAELTKADRERIDRDRATRATDDALATHSDKIEEFRKTHADFDAVCKDAGAIVDDIKAEMGDHVFNVIDHFTLHDSLNSAALMYYLAQHEDEVRVIAAKPVPQQIIALARIDSSLGTASKPSGPAPVATPVKTKAPEPIQPVSSTPTVSTVSAEDEDYQVYKNRRNREDRIRAGYPA